MAKRLIIILIAFSLLVTGVIYLVSTRRDKRLWEVRDASKFSSVQAALDDLPDFWEVRNASKFSSIQAALDDLPDSGGAVFVPPGTYRITSTIVMKPNQSLIGVGPSSIITTETDNINLIDIVGINQSPNDYWDITVQNLQLRGKGSGTGCGIRLRRCHHILIKDLFIKKCYAGIYFDSEKTYDADNIIISNCLFRNNLTYGIKGGGSTPYEWACEDNIIEGCEFEDQQYGIHWQGRLSVIRGNSFEDSFYHHIVLWNGDRNTITGNSIHHARQHGIYMYDTNSNVIANNIINDNDYYNTATYDGIYIGTNSDRNVVIGNVCYNNDKYEIYIAHTDCNKNVLTGNICYGSDHQGAIVDNGTGTISQNNLED